MKQALAIFGLWIGIGCTPFPQLDTNLSQATQSAAYPLLIDITPLLAGQTEATGESEDLDRRLAALKARASQLRSTSIISPATRSRMEDNS